MGHKRDKQRKERLKKKQKKEQRWIHKIRCSPKRNSDDTSKLQLEIQQPDFKRKVTNVLVFVRFLYAGETHLQLVGNANIDVSYILKQEWYQQYRKEKEDKWKMMLNEGILVPRKLKYAKMIKNTMPQLRKLTELGIMNDSIIEGYIKREARQAKEPLSIIGRKDLVNDIKEIVTIQRAYQKLIREHRKNKDYRTRKSNKEIQTNKKH